MQLAPEIEEKQTIHFSSISGACMVEMKRGQASKIACKSTSVLYHLRLRPFVLCGRGLLLTTGGT